MKPDKPFLFIWLFLTGLCYALLWHYSPLPWMVHLAIALNVSTFLLYGLDKFQATSQGERTPERVLFLATFLGGSIGALIGMNMFHHKTRKVSFQFVIAFLILIHVVIAYLLLAYYFHVIPTFQHPSLA